MNKYTEGFSTFCDCDVVFKNGNEIPIKNIITALNAIDDLATIADSLTDLYLKKKTLDHKLVNKAKNALDELKFAQIY